MWPRHLESGGDVERENVTVQRKDVQMVLCDEELDRRPTAMLQPQILPHFTAKTFFYSTEINCYLLKEKIANTWVLPTEMALQPNECFDIFLTLKKS